MCSSTKKAGGLEFGILWFSQSSAGGVKSAWAIKKLFIICNVHYINEVFSSAHYIFIKAIHVALNPQLPFLRDNVSEANLPPTFGIPVFLLPYGISLDSLTPIFSH